MKRIVFSIRVRNKQQKQTEPELNEDPLLSENLKTQDDIEMK